MNCTVNGKPAAVADGSTIRDLLAARKIDPATVAVDRNATLIKRESFGAISLHDGDTVEILRFVGGG